MTDLMRGDQCEPIVKIQIAEKWMRPVIGAQIAVLCLFEERQCPFADTAQLIEASVDDFKGAAALKGEAQVFVQPMELLERC